MATDGELDELRLDLQRGDVGNFLRNFERLPVGCFGNPELTGLTQSLLPPILLAWLATEVDSQHLLTLERLISSGSLLIVEESVLHSMRDKMRNAHRPQLLSDRSVRSPGRSAPNPIPSNPFPAKQNQMLPSSTIEMRRVVIRSTFLVGTRHVSDLICAKRNLCASSQEREFLRAIRLFLPNAWAYPNVPLRNFIDLNELYSSLSRRQWGYAMRGIVDVLVCTAEEDPIAGFELDSALHDSDEVRERDGIKNQIFALAGIPLLRIRAMDISNVRAEDFYELLRTEHEIIDKLRPDHLNARRSHDMLVPV